MDSPSAILPWDPPSQAVAQQAQEDSPEESWLCFMPLCAQPWGTAGLGACSHHSGTHETQEQLALSRNCLTRTGVISLFPYSLQKVPGCQQVA